MYIWVSGAWTSYHLIKYSTLKYGSVVYVFLFQCEHSVIHKIPSKELKTIICFNQNQTRDTSTLTGSSLKLVNKFTHFGSSVSSIENGISWRLAKAWSAIDRLSVIWKSNQSDEIKHYFFQEEVVSILYGCTTWMLWKKHDGNYTRMLLNKSWMQHATTQLQYGHLPPISKTVQIRRIRHAGNCC